MVDDEGEAGAEGDPVSTRSMAAIIKNGRVRISLVVLALVVSGFWLLPKPVCICSAAPLTNVVIVGDH
jgi:hypothetical protein